MPNSLPQKIPYKNLLLPNMFLHPWLNMPSQHYFPLSNQISTLIRFTFWKFWPVPVSTFAITTLLTFLYDLFLQCAPCIHHSGICKLRKIGFCSLAWLHTKLVKNRYDLWALLVCLFNPFEVLLLKSFNVLDWESWNYEGRSVKKSVFIKSRNHGVFFNFFTKNRKNRTFSPKVWILWG